MSGQATNAGLAELLLGPTRPSIAGDRRRQAAVAIWTIAIVCLAIGFAPAASHALTQPSTFLGTILFSFGWWIREALREDRRGARAAAMIATARVGLLWLLLLGFLAFSALVGLVAPDDIAWTAGWWIASAALAVIGGLVSQTERRRHLALVGVCAGLLVAFGSLAGYAAGGTATIVTVIGVPAGLGLLYVSGRSAA